VLEAPEALAPQVAQITREVMENALQLRIPLVADTGSGADWLAAK